jgi:hypothetical protein
MEVIYLLLYIIAAVCFGLGAFSPAVVRFNLVSAGLLAWVLVPLLHLLVGMEV